MQPLRGLLLDIDGTLLDSNDAHAMSWIDAFAEIGIPLEHERIRRMIGMGGDKLVWEAARMRDDSDEGKQLTKRRAAIFASTYLPQLRPFPGGRALLQRARAEGLRLTVATSASGSELDDLLRQAEIDDLIERAATASDAERSKPDPDIVEAAIARSGHRPGELLLLGDTPYDILAARRAGVDTVAVRSGGWSDDELAQSIAIYSDTKELVDSYDDSPLARRANR